MELAALVREMRRRPGRLAGREGVAIDAGPGTAVTIAGRDGAPVALLVSETRGQCAAPRLPGRPQAGRVRVALRRERGRLELSVADDGVGMPPRRPAHRLRR